MMSGELTKVEEMLRRAYADASAIVPDDDIGPGLPAGTKLGRPRRGAGRPVSRRRWLVPATAGAAVAVIALVAGLIIPNVLQQRQPQASAGPRMGYVVRADEVIPVDLTTGRTLRPIDIGMPGCPSMQGNCGVVGAELTPHGSTMYLLTSAGYLVSVDLTTHTVGRRLWITARPMGFLMSPDGRTGYVLESPYGVHVVNLVSVKNTGFIKIANAGSSFVLAPDGKTMYVLSGTGRIGVGDLAGGMAVTPVDTATSQALAPIAIPGSFSTFYDPPSGVIPEVAVAPDGKTVWVAGVLEHGENLYNATEVLTPISTATNTALTPIQLGIARYNPPPSDAIAFGPGGRTVYLAGQEITAVSAATGTASWTTSLPPTDMARYLVDVSPDGRTVYALGRERTGNTATFYQTPVTIYRVSAATGRVQGTPIKVAPGGWVIDDVDRSPNGETLYIRTHKGPHDSMTLFNAATGTVERVIQLPDLSPNLGFLLLGPS